MFRQGTVWQVDPVRAVPCSAVRGEALQGSVGRGFARQAWHVVDRRVLAGQVTARQAGYDKASQGLVRQVHARLGEAGVAGRCRRGWSSPRIVVPGAVRLGRHVTAAMVPAGFGWASAAVASPVEAGWSSLGSFGMAWMARRGRQSRARRFRVLLGWSGFGGAWRGRLGKARCVTAGQVPAGMAWSGRSRLVVCRVGPLRSRFGWQGRSRRRSAAPGDVCHCLARLAGLVPSSFGLAPHGVARLREAGGLSRRTCSA